MQTTKNWRIWFYPCLSVSCLLIYLTDFTCFFRIKMLFFVCPFVWKSVTCKIYLLSVSKSASFIYTSSSKIYTFSVSSFCNTCQFLPFLFKMYCFFLAWAWLAKAKDHSCHTKNQLLPKLFTEKKRVKVRSIPGHYATTKRSIEIFMHFGLDNIIKLKFTTNVGRCATLNVLNCLTKNF